MLMFMLMLTLMSKCEPALKDSVDVITPSLTNSQINIVKVHMTRNFLLAYSKELSK